jgi:hypothetical protein
VVFRTCFDRADPGGYLFDLGAVVMENIVSFKSQSNVTVFPYHKLKTPDGIKREAKIFPFVDSSKSFFRIYTDTASVMADYCIGMTSCLWEMV